MPDARRPASPGQPRRERRDAVQQQEEVDELAAGRRAAQPDAATDARHAERRAHTPRDRDPQRRR